MSELPLITLVTFLPFVGGVVLLCLQDVTGAKTTRWLALGFSLATLGLAACLWGGFDRAAEGLQFVERHEWIAAMNVDYLVGVDGLGVLMVLLTALLVPMAMLASGRVEQRVNLYFALMLFLEAGLLGTFTALSFFHWFLFWELSLIPAFFLIKLWGGRQATAAALQFFVYTMVGSVALLLSFLAMYLATGTFSFLELAELGVNGGLSSAVGERLGGLGLAPEHLMVLVFGGVFLGLAVKVPVVPFHTWLPATYAEAPVPVSMLLTGAMSKMGMYGFVRILSPIFPEEMRRLQTPLLVLAVATIVFAAAAAFAQRDLKRVLAYSSINHLGYCLLGVFAVAQFTGADVSLAAEKEVAMNGVLLQMFNHGLTAATLFCLVGFLEARTGGLRSIDQFGGLRKVAPVFTGLMGIALFASLGLPGLNGFVGEFLIFKGVFPLAPWAAAASTLGLLITAVFILTILQRVFNGPLNERWQALPDLTIRERLLVAPALVLMLALGLWPQFVLGAINSSVMGLVAHLNF